MPRRARHIAGIASSSLGALGTSCGPGGINEMRHQWGRVVQLQQRSSPTSTTSGKPPSAATSQSTPWPPSAPSAIPSPQPSSHPATNTEAQPQSPPLHGTPPPRRPRARGTLHARAWVDAESNGPLPAFARDAHSQRRRQHGRATIRGDTHAWPHNRVPLSIAIGLRARPAWRTANRHLAANTKRIKLGSGGVMLPEHCRA